MPRREGGRPKVNHTFEAVLDLALSEHCVYTSDKEDYLLYEQKCLAAQIPALADGGAGRQFADEKRTVEQGVYQTDARFPADRISTKRRTTDAVGRLALQSFATASLLAKMATRGNIAEIKAQQWEISHL